MTRLNLHSKLFCWQGSYSERDLAREAGFTFDSTLNSWVTPNSFYAWRVRNKTRIEFSESAWERLALLDRQLNRSRSRGGVGPANGSSPTTRAKSGSELFPFQRIPELYLRNGHRRKPFLLCDDPGTGKTCQALSIVNMDRAKSILVICPANKREDWAAAIEDWCDMPAARIGYSETPETLRPPRVFVTSWYMLGSVSYQEWLLKTDFQDIIGDEVHYAKNFTAQRTKGFFRVARKAKRIIGLSGTFPPNYPTELWPFLRFAKPYMRGFPYENKNQYTQKFCIIGVQNQRQFIIGSQNEDELQFHLRANIMVRRSIGDVFPELPPPIIRIQNIESNSVIEQLEEEIKKRAREYLDTDYSVTRVPVGVMAKLRRQLADLKANYIIDFARKILKEEQKLVILGYHTDMLRKVARELSDVGAVLITGATPAAKKHEYKENFQGDLHHRVCVGQLKACGEAIELTAACRGILAEISWVPGENEQGIARINRYGQTRQVIWDVLNVRKSLDERVFRRALRKAADLREVRDNPITGEEAWLRTN